MIIIIKIVIIDKMKERKRKKMRWELTKGKGGVEILLSSFFFFSLSSQKPTWYQATTVTEKDPEEES